MKKLPFCLLFLFLLFVGLLVVVGRCDSARHSIVVHDTIVVPEPILRDSVVVRTRIVRVPVAVRDTLRQSDTIVVADSIDVALPITQKHYGDSLYDAWVSGYDARLDSIRLHRSTMIVERQAKAKRWGLSVGAGAVVTPKGRVDPGLFVGLTYSFYTF